MSRGSEEVQPANELSVVLPTINSAGYIDIILKHYRALNIPAIVFVDNKTSDKTRAIVEQFAERVILISNPSTRVGGMIERMSTICRTSWVLRIDDDELPSRNMMDFIYCALSGTDYDVIGFRRYQCAVSGTGKFLYHSQYTHPQWRLYKPARVKFTGKGHTPGFDYEQNRSLLAPPEALMIHLDWIVHPLDERRAKVKRYDAHTPNDGTTWRHYYLADEDADYRKYLLPLPSSDFDHVGRALAERFPQRAI
jgi:glycosyltransferase involved in cell wall biosynthesis